MPGLWILGGMLDITERALDKRFYKKLTEALEHHGFSHEYIELCIQALEYQNLTKRQKRKLYKKNSQIEQEQTEATFRTAILSMLAYEDVALLLVKPKKKALEAHQGALIFFQELERQEQLDNQYSEGINHDFLLRAGTLAEYIPARYSHETDADTQARHLLATHRIREWLKQENFSEENADKAILALTWLSSSDTHRRTIEDQHESERTSGWLRNYAAVLMCMPEPRHLWFDNKEIEEGVATILQDVKAGTSSTYSDSQELNIASFDTKECPFCAETIKAKAIKCRYCGSDITS